MEGVSIDRSEPINQKTAGVRPCWVQDLENIRPSLRSRLQGKSQFSSNGTKGFLARLCQTCWWQCIQVANIICCTGVAYPLQLYSFFYSYQDRNYRHFFVDFTKVQYSDCCSCTRVEDSRAATSTSTWSTVVEETWLPALRSRRPRAFHLMKSKSTIGSCGCVWLSRFGHEFN